MSCHAIVDKRRPTFKGFKMWGLEVKRKRKMAKDAKLNSLQIDYLRFSKLLLFYHKSHNFVF